MMKEKEISNKEVEIHSLTRWMHVLIAFSLSLIFLDMSMVYLSLPSISLDLHVTTELKWVVLSYFLPFISLPIIVERLLHGVESRKMALIGVSLFTIGSALCGVALLFWQLVIYRVIQGIGGLLLLSSFVRIINSKQIGIMGLLGGGMGLLFGGIILNHWSWHLIFLINALLGLTLYYFCLWHFQLESRSTQVPHSVLTPVVQTAFIIFLAIGFSPYRDIWGIPTIFFLLVGLGMILLWFFKEKKYLSLKKKPFLFLIESFHSFVVSSLAFIIPFYFAKELKLSSFSIGLLLLLFLLIPLIIIKIRKRWFDSLSIHLHLFVRSVFLLIGLFLFLPLNQSWNSIDLVIRLGLLSIGYGFFSIRFYINRISLFPFWLIGWLMGPILCTLIWTPNMLDTLPNLVDMRAILYMLILFVLLSLIFVMGMRMGARVVDKHEST